MATTGISIPYSHTGVCGSCLDLLVSLLIIIPITPNLSSTKLHWYAHDQSRLPPSLSIMFFTLFLDSHCVCLLANISMLSTNATVLYLNLVLGGNLAHIITITISLPLSLPDIYVWSLTSTPTSKFHTLGVMACPVSFHTVIWTCQFHYSTHDSGI